MQGSNAIQVRLRELAKIAAETEHDQLTELVNELNQLLDEEHHHRQPAAHPEFLKTWSGGNTECTVSTCLPDSAILGLPLPLRTVLPYV